MKIKSQISDAIKKKLFNTFIINEDVFSLMAEKEQLSDKQEKYRYETNIENVQQSLAVQTYKKELVIEHMLDNGTYDFRNSLLILNYTQIFIIFLQSIPIYDIVYFAQNLSYIPKANINNTIKGNIYVRYTRIQL